MGLLFLVERNAKREKVSTLLLQPGNALLQKGTKFFRGELTSFHANISQKDTRRYLGSALIYLSTRRGIVARPAKRVGAHASGLRNDRTAPAQHRRNGSGQEGAVVGIGAGFAGDSPTVAERVMVQIEIASGLAVGRRTAVHGDGHSDDHFAVRVLSGAESGE